MGTQEELAALLSREGFDVTQATLSRDLARLRARRVTLPEGGTAYELDDAPVGNGVGRLSGLKTLVLTVKDNGSLVVIQTTPGAASAVALAIDQARLPEALGTLAGDDTIFLAPAAGVPAGKATRRLLDLFGKGKANG